MTTDNKLPQASKPAAETSGQTSVQATVKQMQSYFSVTGAYRSEDVTRIFGDQRQGRGFVMHDGYAASTRRHD